MTAVAVARVPRGVWLIACTPTWRPYPCTCWLGRACRLEGHPGYLCRCVGRLDLDHCPAHCCAKRAAETTKEQQK